jgi:hypothetical protein
MTSFFRQSFTTIQTKGLCFMAWALAANARECVCENWYDQLWGAENETESGRYTTPGE